MAIIGDFILWNSEKVTLRYSGKNFENTTLNGEQKLTNNSVPWKGTYFSKSVPNYLSFPMLGTRDIDTGDVNFLYLPRNTIVFMLKKDIWKNVDVDGWTFTRDEGNYLGPTVGRVKIYKRQYSPGRYKIDNKSALYLFDDKGISLEILKDFFGILNNCTQQQKH